MYLLYKFIIELCPKIYINRYKSFPPPPFIFIVGLVKLIRLY